MDDPLGEPADRHFDHVEDLRMYDWYHGAISKDDAYAKIVAASPGAFLVRLSSRPGTFVITWYRTETSVVHTLCTYNGTAWKIEIEDGVDVQWKSVSAILKSYSKVMRVPVNRTQRYTGTLIGVNTTTSPGRTASAPATLSTPGRQQQTALAGGRSPVPGRMPNSSAPNLPPPAATNLPPAPNNSTNLPPAPTTINNNNNNNPPGRNPVAQQRPPAALPTRGSSPQLPPPPPSNGSNLPPPPNNATNSSYLPPAPAPATNLPPPPGTGSGLPPPPSSTASRGSSTSAVSSSAGSGASGRPLPPPPSHFNAPQYAQVPEDLRAESDPWELDINEFVLTDKLGSGAYGTVYKSTYKGKPVALKKMNAQMLQPSDISAFKKEAKLMKMLTPHPNVVQLVGVNTDETRGELFIVTEFCGGGSLDSYLIKNGHLLAQLQRISMIVAASRGVRHLHSQLIVHRDLAVRNFLLTTEGGLKVADFGMSRDLSDGNSTKSDVGPLRYMAPESIAKRMYSNETDVWAFGVVMWEIESNAAIPYGDMTLITVAMKVTTEGLRLSQPTGCPDALYQLMMRCWSHDSQDRPSMQAVEEELIAIATNLTKQPAKK